MISAAPPNIVQTVLGNVFPNGLGQGGFEFLSGDGYPATDARIGPTTQGLAIDPSGNLFIGDFYNYTVRRVDASTGVITSILPDPGVLSNFTPYFMAAGPDGTIYVNTTYPATANPTTIWGIRDGTMTAVASFTGALNGEVCTYTPDGAPANSGCIGYPQGISVDGAGNMYVADQKFCTIRQISPDGTLGTVTGIAGTCATGGDGGRAAAATVGGPTLLASDSAGNIWFSDCGRSNCGTASGMFSLRRIAADRSLITSVWVPEPNTVQLLSLGVDNQGNALAYIYSPSAWAGMCGASGHCIVRISTNGSLTLIAGAGPAGIPSPDGVPALGATLGCVDTAPTFLGGITMNAAGQIFFAESCTSDFAGGALIAWSSNNVIRRLDPAVQLLSSSQISTSASGLSYSRVTKTYNGTVTIKNISSTTISGPFQIVFSNLTSGVQLGDSTGQYNGSPYITVSGTASLASGQSATVSVQFTDPSNSAINFTPLIYAGSF